MVVSTNDTTGETAVSASAAAAADEATHNKRQFFVILNKSYSWS